MYQVLRFSSAYDTNIAVTANSPNAVSRSKVLLAFAAHGGPAGDSEYRCVRIGIDPRWN